MLHHGPEQQAPARMIWVWLEPRADPAERVLQHRPQSVSRQAASAKGPPGAGATPANASASARCCHPSRFTVTVGVSAQQVGQRRLLVDQPDHLAGIAIGDQERRERPAGACPPAAAAQMLTGEASGRGNDAAGSGPARHGKRMAGWIVT